MSDPRFTLHGPTIQGIPPTNAKPLKRLSHTIKATPSAPITGAFAPIATRVPLVGILSRKRRRK